jgi:hypothetical protein
MNCSCNHSHNSTKRKAATLSTATGRKLTNSIKDALAITTGEEFVQFCAQDDAWDEHRTKLEQSIVEVLDKYKGLIELFSDTCYLCRNSANPSPRKASK